MNEMTKVGEKPIIDSKTIDEFLFTSGTKLDVRQKQLFLKMAQLNGLNPFKREIYAIPFGSGFNIVTGYQVYIARAEASGKLDGWDVIANDQEAVITIHRKDMTHPIVWRVMRSDFDKGVGNWVKMPDFMIKKIAIGQGFRLAFPNELAAMPYTSDEIDDNPTNHQAEENPVETPAAITDKDKTTNGGNLDRVLKYIPLPKKSLDLLVEDSNKYGVDVFSNELVRVIDGYISKGIENKKFDPADLAKIMTEIGELALMDASLDNALLALDSIIAATKNKKTEGNNAGK